MATTYLRPHRRVILLLWVLLLGLLLAACGRQPAPPVQVDFARLTRGEPLPLAVGDAFTLVGYAPEMVSVAADGVLTPAATEDAEGHPAQTTLVASTPGATAITITQNLCEGVATCNGPALFLTLHVQVQ